MLCAIALGFMLTFVQINWSKICGYCKTTMVFVGNVQNVELGSARRVLMFQMQTCDILVQDTVHHTL